MGIVIDLKRKNSSAKCQCIVITTIWLNSWLSAILVSERLAFCINTLTACFTRASYQQLELISGRSDWYGNFFLLFPWWKAFSVKLVEILIMQNGGCTCYEKILFKFLKLDSWIIFWYTQLFKRLWGNEFFNILKASFIVPTLSFTTRRESIIESTYNCGIQQVYKLSKATSFLLTFAPLFPRPRTI